jgi:hypothetical protein
VFLLYIHDVTIKVVIKFPQQHFDLKTIRYGAWCPDYAIVYTNSECYEWTKQKYWQYISMAIAKAALCV